MSLPHPPHAPRPQPDPMRPALCAVQRISRETDDTFSMRLAPPPGWAGFRPGQFTMLWLPGIGESAISISGDPDDRDVIEQTIRSVGPVTEALAKLRRGDLVGVRGPYGEGWPMDQAAGNDVVIIAGGIGLAPLRPVLTFIAQHRALFRRVSLLYGARKPTDVLFPEELDHWRTRADIDVEVTVDQASSGWMGRVGVVTSLIPRLELDPARLAVFLCGPEVMMRFSARGLELAGVPVDRMWVSMERNMKCGVGLCGHCQFGHLFVCKDGPVIRFDRVSDLFVVHEV